MPKTKRNVALLFLLSISILVMTWCQKDITIENDENNTDQTIEQPVSVTEQKLVINNWCIWCGRCVMNAPQNFTMSERRAQVSSQENINSTDVSRAIKNCPVSVIEIIEV